MPFVATTGYRVPLFQNVLEPSISPRAAAADPSPLHIADDSSPANDLAAEAYNLFVENRLRVEFDRQPSDTLDAIARSESLYRPPIGVEINKTGAGYAILDHLNKALRAQFGGVDSEQLNAQASAVVAALTSRDMWNAETKAMRKTFVGEGLQLRPDSANVGIRVRLNEDRTGWVLHKTVFWRSYVDRSGEERYMDDGSPILRVDNQIEIRFDWHSGDDFTRTASCRFCHIGWSDPLLDSSLLVAHEGKRSPDSAAREAKHVPLKPKGMYGFFHELYNLLAYCLGARGIVYEALKMTAVSAIIDDAPTMRPKPVVDEPGSVSRGIHIVKNDPLKCRHYAAANLHTTDIEAFHFSRTRSNTGSVWMTAAGIALPRIDELIRQGPDLSAKVPPPHLESENMHSAHIDDPVNPSDLVQEAVDDNEDKGDEQEDEEIRAPALPYEPEPRVADVVVESMQSKRAGTPVLSADDVTTGYIQTVLSEPPRSLDTPPLTEEQKARLQPACNPERQPTDIP